MGEVSQKSRMQRLRRRISRFRKKLPLSRTWHLRMSLQSTDRFYRQLAAEAKGDKERQQEVFGEWSHVAGEIEEELEEIFTKRLVKKARRWYVPIPPHPYGRDTYEDENWERGHATGIWYLKPEGVSKVRNLMREEKKWRRDYLIGWVGPLIGLIGALTGLISVWLRR